MTAKIYIGNRVVGDVINGAFVKRVSARRHFLQYPPAIATDVTAILQAEKHGATRVIVIDRDSGKQYSAPIELIRSAGFVIDRGFGQQLALPLNKWNTEDALQERML